jgi:outer membrane protein TolC
MRARYAGAHPKENRMPPLRRAFALTAAVTLSALARAALAQAQAPTAVPPDSASAAQSAPTTSTAPVDNLGDVGDAQLDLSNALRAGGESLTADQAAAQAIKTAPTVARARAAADRAREGASQALVGVYPRLDLQASYTRLSKHDPATFGQIMGVIGPPGMEVPFMSEANGFETIPDQFQLQATLTYPVSDLFFSILPRYKAAAEASEAQALNAEAERHSIGLAAREAFYNYARARATLQVARSSLAASQAQQRDVKSLVAAGTLARVELMRADAGVATASVAVARAEGGVAVARTALRSLLHAEGETDIGITEELSTPLPALTASKQSLLAQALRKRSEIAALRTMLRVHERNRDANAADGYPKLGINGAAELSNPNGRVAPNEREFRGSWQVSGVLSWSPNDYAASRGRAGQAGADREQTFAEIASLEDALRREVSAAYEDYVAAGSAMEAALTGIAAAEESYRVRREQFRAGAAVATDVVDAEAELRRARLELINAAIDVRIARARLDRAVER